jgi:hypothetical protein
LNKKVLIGGDLKTNTKQRGNPGSAWLRWVNFPPLRNTKSAETIFGCSIPHDFYSSIIDFFLFSISRGCDEPARKPKQDANKGNGVWDQWF